MATKAQLLAFIDNCLVPHYDEAHPLRALVEKAEPAALAPLDYEQLASAVLGVQERDSFAMLAIARQLHGDPALLESLRRFAEAAWARIKEDESAAGSDFIRFR